MPHSAEAAALCRAAHACLPAGAAASAPPPVESQPDWHRVLWLARRERALLFLQRGLAGGELSLPCPPEVRAQLDLLRSAAHVQAFARTREVCALHDAFTHAGLSFTLADDWMFERCFAPHETFSECTTDIRVLVAREDLARAREVVDAKGHPPATGQFQVAPIGHAPVALLAQPGYASCEAGPVVAGRAFRRLTTAAWLGWLAAETTPRPHLDLLRAWQVVALAWFAREGTVGNDPAVRTALQRSRRVLNGSEFQGSRMGDATPPPGMPEALPRAPFVPTPAPVLERMLALAGTNDADVVMDLGCGDGRLILEAARRFGAQAIGIDCDPALIAQAEAQAAAEGLAPRARFRCADLFTADLREASIITLYLLPVFYEPLRALLRAARPGTRIVSHDYYFRDWPPEKTELVRSSPTRVAQIYLWRVGKNPAG